MRHILRLKLFQSYAAVAWLQGTYDFVIGIHSLNMEARSWDYRGLFEQQNFHDDALLPHYCAEPFPDKSLQN